MGKRVMGENITLHDDVYHPLQSGAPFDGEGIPRQRVLLVDQGVPRNLVYARATAKKMKAKPTGHGFSLPNDYGEAPMNLVFSGEIHPWTKWCGPPNAAFSSRGSGTSAKSIPTKKCSPA